MADVLMVPASRTHGRGAEVEHLVRVTGRGGAVVVEGSPGIGKTALLDTVLDRFDDHRVLRVSGRRPESGLPLSGLHGLFLPVTHRLGALGPEHGRLLDDALRRGRYDERDRLALSVAVLALVTALTRARPLVCVVDDAQWIDSDSLALLSFAAHRVDTVGAAMLFATREAAPEELSGLPRLRLGPLPEETLQDVLEETDPGVDPAVRGELVRRAHGNPMAVRCYASALTPGQRTGVEPLPRMLPLPAEIMDAHAEVLAFLPDDITRLLLLAAIEPGVAVPVLTAREGGSGDPAAALDRAERAGLLRVAADRVEFADPMMGEVVCRRATSAELAGAHLEMARMLDSRGPRHRVLWHRAAAASGPDEELGHEITAAVSADEPGLTAHEASVLLERAAELTGKPSRRAGRLAEASYQAWAAGQYSRSTILIKQAAPYVPMARTRGLPDMVDGYRAIGEEDPLQGCDQLMSAAREVAARDPHHARSLLLRAADAASLAGDLDRFVAAARQSLTLDLDNPLRDSGLAYLEGSMLAFQGDYEAAMEPLRRSVALVERDDEPLSLIRSIVAALRLGDTVGARRQTARAIARAGVRGTVSMVPQALSYAVHGEFWHGSPTTAGEHASLGLRLSVETGQRNCAAHHLAALAMVAALRGDAEDCAVRAAAVTEHTDNRPLGLPRALTEWALAFLDLTRGRMREAATRLEELAHSEPCQGHRTIRLLSVPHYVEAAAHLGETERAAVALAGYERWANATEGPNELALAARCRALLSDGEAAREHFEEALRLHRRGGGGGIEEARTRMAYGTLLRRSRLPSAARPHLRAAVEAFTRLEAPLLLRQAKEQLRATGEALDAAAPAPTEGLTPQQEQIARLVAEGATNREIAQRLYISPRTVEHHLRNIFRQLQIRSRVELARLVSGR
ncbi:AAA family ATPase [Thermobifida halotolerans]|uniref:AAA family ATPase n=1 Tax=Thermobifida halotolerans TaxID=483545 RepID=A0AA97M140_9ACTN|nr:LuxR family transcriptional regulator [Thermobifida halotolerans]UOE21568.1 AAA family ATPase [Thermobifida halotolerans]